MTGIIINTLFIIYCMIVFVTPWATSVYHLIKFIRYLMDNDQYYSLWIFKKEDRIKYRNWIKNDEKAQYLYIKVKKWFILTFILWITGFLLLLTIFYLLANIIK